ncbi:MAG: hypothetical protein COU90_03490 [Candidatus Ryanbacteria bacterium CG10_big_fil_rev_8_21_14_0_10_43_42]|uniref:Uncharacterized protein n=1 Tax=Candidatus Ryanbacteria bacterium CG10_big_fil_rev_8_21_14_0_10_43_42 TaxID=1974864 RepID=A0A2M8KX30_9BACT|nr:MAG: hypothetical protein COU90_03490 [Candidatus Ryanbacteria bacterium CG10_big_fil_rev_8_21_14_0_10_43_42]
MSSPHTKSLGTGILAVMFSVPFWFFYKQGIDFGSLDGTPTLYALGFLILYFVSISILFLFNDYWRVFMGTILFSTVPFFFFFGTTALTGGSAFIFFLGSMHALTRVQQERRNRLTFKVPILLHQGLPLFLTLFAFILATAYFIETKNAPSEITFKDIIPKKTFTRLLRTTQPYIGENILPGFNQNLMVDEYIMENLKSSGINISALTDDESQSLLIEARRQLISRVGLPENSPPLSGQETLGDTLYIIITEKSTALFEPYRQFLPLAFAIGFFLFLRTIALPFGWLVSFIALLIVTFFKSHAIIAHEDVQATKEIVRWS